MNPPAAAPSPRARWTMLIVVMLAVIGWLRPVSLASAQPPSATPTAGLSHCAAPVAPLVTPRAVNPSGTVPASPAPLAFRLVADVPLPGSASRFDYQSLDPTTGRLYLAHMGADQIVVFDTEHDRVLGSIARVKTPTGVLVVPQIDRVFVAATGSHDVAVIDPQSLTVIAHVGPIGFPDGLAYAPQSKQVFVSDEAGGGELVIDATTNRAVTTIDLGGEAGNTQFDPGSGCILVAVQNRDQLVVIDPRTDRLVGRYDLDPACQGPHGFTLDGVSRLAFVSCEDNATLLVVDLMAMRTTQTTAVGDRPDVLAFDSGWHQLYVAAESGIVSVFAEQDHRLQPLGSYHAPHAHTIAVDPATHRLYLPLENVDGKPVLRMLEPTT